MNDGPIIIHEDDCLLVVYKPGGMPAVSLKSGERGTLASWILDIYPEQAEIGPGNREAGLCHRLDNDTSGLMVAARTAQSYESLRAQFISGEIVKEYTALVIGIPPEECAIDAPIAHHPRKKAKMVVCDSAARADEWKGRPARTFFSVVKRYELNDKGRTTHYALVSVRIETGVRHQIRAHMAHVGHPLAGDWLYQNPAKRAADTLPLARHFLHCSRLSFRHPASGGLMSFTSPLPDELQDALNLMTE